MENKLTIKQIMNKYKFDRDLSYCNLSEANLSGANLRGANLRGADLSGANLREADLSLANLREANLSVANLCGANLSVANLCGANLRGADLRGANLSNISGKEILIFIGEKHFAYYADNIVKIGCISKTPDEWLNNYTYLSEEYTYTDQQIKKYLFFIKMCKQMDDK